MLPTHKSKVDDCSRLENIIRHHKMTKLTNRVFSFSGLSWFLGTMVCLACIALVTSFGFPDNFDDLAALTTAVTGLLTVATLILTLYTVNLQRQDIEAQRSEFIKASSAQIRSMHSELLLQAIQDPDLLAVWEPDLSTEPLWYKQSVYVNQILSHWQTLFEMDEITVEKLELLLDSHMPKPAFKRFWNEARDIRARFSKMSSSSSDRLLFTLAERAYQQSMVSEQQNS